VILAYAWRTPRFQDARHWAAPRWLQRVVDGPAWRTGCRGFGLAVFGYALMAAVFGKDTLNNPFIYLFYVFLWIAPVPLSLLFGDFWRAVSPVRTIHLAVARLTGGDPALGVLTYPARLGCWPAAAGLFAFVWLELVYPANNELGPVRLWFAAYVAVMLVGGALWGDTFFTRADPFEVYSSLIAKLSPWGRDHGALVLRSPLANLHTLVAPPGLVAVVGVLLGSTAFDSFSSTNAWATFQNTQSSTWLASGMLVIFCAGVTGLIAAGAVLADGRLTGPKPTGPKPTGPKPTGPKLRRRELPGTFAHSIVPIVVGYVVAHYFTFLVHVGQYTISIMSDPFETGANWFGTADWSVNYWLNFHPTLVANIKVLGVVLGHLVAVVSAHDRAVSVLPEDQQIRGQLPLLVVMVFFTAGGLFLLFSS
ncbi:MAG: hypothetical protein ACRCYU_20115, partial [Nocardioides sp.]